MARGACAIGPLAGGVCAIGGPAKCDRHRAKGCQFPVCAYCHGCRIVRPPYVNFVGTVGSCGGLLVLHLGVTASWCDRRIVQAFLTGRSERCTALRSAFKFALPLEGYAPHAVGLIRGYMPPPLAPLVRCDPHPRSAAPLFALPLEGYAGPRIPPLRRTEAWGSRLMGIKRQTRRNKRNLRALKP
eukprot:1191294-Prorocentrum_minimum.AAC.6